MFAQTCYSALMQRTTAHPDTLPATCTDALERYLDPTIFKALGDPTRLALLARLATASGPQTVTELSSCCGVHLSGVSRHLKMLYDAALIRSERQGREVRYRLDCGALTATLRGLADALEQCQEQCCKTDHQEKEHEHDSPE